MMNFDFFQSESFKKTATYVMSQNKINFLRSSPRSTTSGGLSRWRLSSLSLSSLSSSSTSLPTSLTGDPAAGEHWEGEQERHHRVVLEDQEVRGGGQDRQRRGETWFLTETKYFFFFLSTSGLITSFVLTQTKYLTVKILISGSSSSVENNCDAWREVDEG